MKNYPKYIVRNPAIMLGKPTVKGTRITVELIIRKFTEGHSLKDILENYPHLKKDQVIAARKFATIEINSR